MVSVRLFLVFLCAGLARATLWGSGDESVHPSALLNFLSTTSRSDPRPHSRGGLRNDYVHPTCTGPKQKYTFPDGTSFDVCEPTDMDKPFGMYGEYHQSLAGQSMSFIPMDPDHFDEERGIVREMVEQFLRPYRFAGPGGVGIGTFLRQVYVFYSLMIGGGNAEGAFFYEPGDTLWMSQPDVMRAKHRFRQTLHHELAHLLEENLVGAELNTPRATTWRAKWKETLPGGFEYTAKNYARPSYWFTPMSYKDGFLTGYNRASMVEDVAQFCSTLVVGHPQLWKCHDASPRCAKKVDLAIQLYSFISPRYTKEYFRGIAREAEDTKMHKVYEGPISYEDIMSMEQASDEVKLIDESYEAYVETASALDRVPNAFPDPQPRYKSAPRTVRAGPSNVEVIIETQPGAKFYGNNEMSQRATYVPVPSDEVERQLGIVNRWASFFPHGLGNSVKRIAMSAQLNTPGNVYGVFFPDPAVEHTVFLGAHITKLDRFRGKTSWTPGHTLRWAKTLAHEATHCIANSFYKGHIGSGARDPVEWRKAYLTSNPRGWEYLGKGAPGTDLEFDPKMFAKGFVSGYSRVSIDEDIAQTGAALLIGAKEIWECARESTACAKKVDLIIELFGMMSPRYNKRYFEGIRTKYVTATFPAETEDGTHAVPAPYPGGFEEK